MELARVMSIQLVQDLDDIGISIGTAKDISSAVKAQDQLFRLHEGFRCQGRTHSVKVAVYITRVRHRFVREYGEG